MQMHSTNLGSLAQQLTAAKACIAGGALGTTPANKNREVRQGEVRRACTALALPVAEEEEEKEESCVVSRKSHASLN